MDARSIAQDLMLAVLPGGGQRTARRNAWSGMAADAARSRATREAEAAIAAAALRRNGRRTGT